MSDSPNKQQAKKAPQIAAAFAATFGAFALGTGIAWTSPALPYLVDCIEPGDNDTDVDPDSTAKECTFQSDLGTTVGSWIGAFYPLGCFVSCLATGVLMARIGRKWTMMCMVPPFVLGWVLLVIAKPLGIDEPALFYVGRFLTGAGGGSFSLAAPIYIAEACETSLRGALGSLMQFMVTVGILFSNAVGAAVAEDWDVLTGICIAFPLLLGVLMLFFPESPYYLLKRGRTKAASHALVFLRGKDYDVAKELDAMRASQETEEQIGTVSARELFLKRVYLQPLLIMLSMMILQQFSGVNAVLYYLQDIFLAANVKNISAGLSASIVSLVQVLATGVSVLVVERVGRKPLLIASDAVMCVSILALGVFFYLDENKCGEDTDQGPWSTPSPPADCQFSQQLISDLGWLPLTSLIIYIMAFSIGFGPLPWIIAAEMSAPEARGPIATLANALRNGKEPSPEFLKPS